MNLIRRTLRDKIRFIVDVIACFAFSLFYSIGMVEGMLIHKMNINPATAFIITYLINLSLYRIYRETPNNKAKLHLNMYCTAISFTNNAVLIAYLIYFGFHDIFHRSITDIFTDYVTYATTVGCISVIYMCIDNLIIFIKHFVRHDDKNKW